MDALVNILIGLAVAAGVFSLAVVAVIFVFIGWGIRRAVYAIKGEEYKPLLGSGKADAAYEHLDVDAGATSESIAAVLKRYASAQVVGKRARSGLDALQADERTCASFHAVLEKKFAPGSLSWDKFAAGADLTHDALLRNCASLANRIQVFDRASYIRQERGHRSSTWRKGAIIDSTTAEKQRVLQASLDEMDALIRANDGLLTELDKLTFALGQIADADSQAESERIVEELRTLIDETKYYSQ